MKIYPQNNRVYILLDKVEEKQIRGIYIPDKHSEKTRIGTVKAYGKDVEEYKIGDKVLVQYYAGVVIDLFNEGMDDDTHRIVNASNILAIIGD